ncbi:MAG TPA: glycosyltransferase family 2 protein [Lentimicrobium sp.]|nr:glycosyltransferase family 2 protein [Lentimicrobium sp.]
MNTNLAILIPVYNALPHTIKCLTLLNSMIKLSAESEIQTIIIDDGSSDGTEKWIRENFPKTTILKGEGNLWWSGGINVGIKYALRRCRAEYILWWNNDIIPESDYFQNLLLILQNKEVMIGGSKIYYAHQKNIIWSMGGIFDTKTGKKFMIGMNEPDGEQFNKVTEVDWLPGMGTFIHKSVFEKIGLVDDNNFPQYHGDSDFTFRATLAGYRIQVFPQLKIWNDKSNSGLLHQNNYKLLIRSLKDIKSNYHLLKDIRFYRRYATSPLAYQTLAYKYCFYLGGFIKWKFLSLLGQTKKEHYKI